VDIRGGQVNSRKTTEREVEEVFEIVSGKIKKLVKEGSRQRAALAKLRRGVGKELGEVPEVWDITLADLPGHLTSEKGVASPAERAIHLALTLFAMHQQGKSQSVSRSGISFGTAVRKLVSIDEKSEQAIKRRFDAALTAKNLFEFSHHARGLIQLMKAKGVFLHYPQFAKDLYRYQNPDCKSEVMLEWGEDFWAPAKKRQRREEEQEESLVENRIENQEEGVQL
jgi:CRISPR system Cascade subunit CasB